MLLISTELPVTALSNTKDLLFPLSLTTSPRTFASPTTLIPAVIVQTPYGPTPIFHTDPVVKQGTVLGPNLCSASTGEYCGENIGVCVGNIIISSLLYVDDIIDLSSSSNDYVAAHLKALLFSKRKKLNLSGTKCYTMILNKKTKDGEVPVLIIDEENNVILATEIKYLGDI